ncbi:oxidoreductase [Xylaria arbuscula]|nr:oxidoreductase [Xylaria arbuscula]
MAPKTVLITGCSAGGIGAAIVSALARQSHHVFATARHVDRIPEELANHANVTVLPLDISSPESLAAAVEAVATSGKQLDVLVNNAGGGYSMPILDIDIDKAKQVYETNVWGSVRMIQSFAPLIIQSKGRIVNMSTCGAVVNTPWISAYLSSKAALTNLSETLRLELAPFGVSVVTVMPGVIGSHFHDNEPQFKLPEGSRYSAIENIIAGWASGKSKPGGCTTEQFADMVVQDIVGDGKGGMAWRGPHASSIKVLAHWLPTWCQDTFMSMNQGLKELTDAYTSAAKE